MSYGERGSLPQGKTELRDVIKQLNTHPYRYLPLASQIVIAKQTGITEITHGEGEKYPVPTEFLFESTCAAFKVPYVPIPQEPNYQTTEVKEEIEIIRRRVDFKGVTRDAVGPLNRHMTIKNGLKRSAKSGFRDGISFTEQDLMYNVFEEQEEIIRIPSFRKTEKAQEKEERQRPTLFVVTDKRGELDDEEMGARIFLATYYARSVDADVRFITYDHKAEQSRSPQAMLNPGSRQYATEHALRPVSAYKLIQDIIEEECIEKPHILHIGGGWGNTDISPTACAREMYDLVAYHGAHITYADFSTQEKRFTPLSVFLSEQLRIYGADHISVRTLSTLADIPTMISTIQQAVSK